MGEGEGQGRRGKGEGGWLGVVVGGGEWEGHGGGGKVGVGRQVKERGWQVSCLPPTPTVHPVPPVLLCKVKCSVKMVCLPIAQHHCHVSGKPAFLSQNCLPAMF